MNVFTKGMSLMWLMSACCTTANADDYYPQPYTPATNNSAQLSQKKAALQMLRTRWKDDSKWDHVKGEYSKSYMQRFAKTSSHESIAKHFSKDGSWHKRLPTGAEFSKKDYELNREYLSEVLTLAYMNKYEGKGYKNTIYKTLSWYFTKGHAAPHKYHETFIYQDSKKTTGQQLVRIGHLLYDEIHADRSTDSDVETLFQQMRKYCSVFINSAPQIRGANWGLRMDECLLYLLFTNDPRDMDEYSYFWKKSLDFVRWDTSIGNGLQIDWSMTHHGDMNYWGMYGWAIVQNAMLFGELFKDTPWDYTTEKMDFIADCLLEGLRWNYYRGVMEFTSAPKHSVIKTGAKDVSSSLNELFSKLAEVGTGRLSRESEILAAAANYDVPFWKKGSENESIPTSHEPVLTGHRYFWSTENQAHRRSNFAIHVNRSSQRSRPPESREGANYTLHYGSGFTPIMRRGDEMFLSRLAWDFEHLPGTTVEQKQTTGAGFAGSHTRGLNLFSGGVTDGEYGFGAFVMNMVRFNNDMSGKYEHVNGAGATKGTFFFDDGMVALGQNINRIATVSGKHEILTTINNVRRVTDVTYSVDGTTNVVTVGESLQKDFTINDVAWFHHDGVGYVIWPSASSTTELVASFKNVSLNSEIKDSYKKLLKSELGNTAGNRILNSEKMNMFRLWLNHGVNPVDDTYSYVVLPDSTIEDVENYVAHPPVQIVENSGGVQAVECQAEGIYYASFENAGKADFSDGKAMVVDRPLMVMARKDGDDYTFTAANPTHRGLRRDYVSGTGPTVGSVYEDAVSVETGGFGAAQEISFDLSSERGEEGSSVQAKITAQPPVPPISSSSTIMGVFADWLFDNRVDGIDSGASATDWSSATPETAAPGWILTKTGGSGSGLTVDSAKGTLVLTGAGDGRSGISEAILPFEKEQSQGYLNAKLGLDSGSTWSAAKLSLVHIGDSSITPLVEIAVQRDGSNKKNQINTGNGSSSIKGIWEDVFNSVEINWGNGNADIVVNGLERGPVKVQNADFLVPGLTPNAILIRVGTDGDTKTRKLKLDELSIQFPVGINIGNPNHSGSFEYSDGVYSVKGGGNNIWGRSDQCFFASQTHSGDGEIIARVESVGDTDTWAKSGVMFRENLNAKSANVMIYQRPDNTVAMQWRTSMGEKTKRSSLVGGTATPKWIKLVRKTNNYTGYYSVDGVAWTTIASVKVAMPSHIEVGLAVTSHDGSKLCHSDITNVVIIER